ncbi:thioesterase family protein [Pseudonocardia sp. KRD-184]|uniref:Thioesterase family protein n=1 Tax=Pseudonocardia oceani TaxID=2792013 RepID=A0ABS6UD29_9PSEU|nr:acyl-CoA thioesterase domain-containing protein [Pseudonocardia oceani]MBW0089039.1 thioesterase family protein [Pseudonocardia oceani]MBW0094740.1 thioesterase family protein [Pseudonocardia oceani]MBW0110736.1 thioesterase family protein [Pseudonocardia oceani]MBW0121370.1 thioesterase family protein [Pseudonocardia oceani]MBW0130112.1 thioesterase family protein [Pseudonocardia oceani]
MSTSKHLLDVLSLTPDGDDTFVGHPQVIPSGRVYGGELVAQAQVAMSHTVGDDRPGPSRVSHSLHGYFLRAGDVQQPTRWVVQRLRDGRNFSVRAVQGIQGDRVLFQAMGSFQVPGPGVEHQEPMPDLPDPESLPTSEEALRGSSVRDARYWSHDRSFDIRHSPAAIYTAADGEPVRRQTVWLRAFETLPDDPALHRSALAYVCDYTLLEPVLRQHGAAWSDDGLVTASLDHAMWWHHDGRMDDWVALVQESPVALRGLGLGSARLYSRDGALLASVTQEGLVHL